MDLGLGDKRPNLFKYAKTIRQGNENWEQTMKRAQQELNDMFGVPTKKKTTTGVKKATTAKKATTGTKKAVKRTPGVCKGREQPPCAADPVCNWIVPTKGKMKPHCRTRAGGVASKTRVFSKCHLLPDPDCKDTNGCKWVKGSTYVRNGKNVTIKPHCSAIKLSK